MRHLTVVKNKKWYELVNQAIEDSLSSPLDVHKHLETLSCAQELCKEGFELPFLFWFAREAVMRHWMDCKEEEPQDEEATT